MGYNKALNSNGYDEDGYDREGYDKDGYNRDGYNKDGYNRDGYDEDGYDKDGYDEDGYDEEGYDEYGYDRDGYNEYGYNQDGYDAGGYDTEGYDELGYDVDGYDINGYNRIGYNREGFDCDGYDCLGLNVLGQTEVEFYKSLTESSDDSDDKNKSSDDTDSSDNTEEGEDNETEDEAEDEPTKKAKEKETILSIRLQEVLVKPALVDLHQALSTIPGVRANFKKLSFLRKYLLPIKPSEVPTKLTSFANTSVVTDSTVPPISKGFRDIVPCKKIAPRVYQLIYKDKKTGCIILEGKTLKYPFKEYSVFYYGPKYLEYQILLESHINRVTGTQYCTTILNRYRHILDPTVTPVGGAPLLGLGSNISPGKPFFYWENIVSRYKKDIEIYLKSWVMANTHSDPSKSSIKTGLIFEGPAGSGKSSLASAIANLLGYTIYYVDLTQNFEESFSKIGKNTVVVMEDIDMLMGTTKNNMQDRVVLRDKNSLAKLSQLMNLIDGKVQYDHVVFIATTNNIDALDFALKRKGRFDKIYKIGEYNEAEIREYCAKRHINADSVIKEHGTHITPGDLNAYLNEFIARRQYYLSKMKARYLEEKQKQKQNSTTQE